MKLFKPKSITPAFTLLEVLIAMVIFFVAIFALLELTTSSLRAARSLQVGIPTAAMLAAEISTVTNKLEEGSESGDFGDDFPGYAWRREIVSAGTNGFFRVDFWIESAKQKPSANPDMSIFLFRPYSNPIK